MQDHGNGYQVETELIRAGGMGGGIGSILYTDKDVAYNTSPPEFFIYNAIGHTVALTNHLQNVTQTSLYEAFGERVASTGTSTNVRLRNTKERDVSVGLDNDGFRYYDPSTGSYVQRDPIGYADGLNAYHSVGNNPINDTDPTGLKTQDRNALAAWISGGGTKTQAPVAPVPPRSFGGTLTLAGAGGVLGGSAWISHGVLVGYNALTAPEIEFFSENTGGGTRPEGDKLKRNRSQKPRLVTHPDRDVPPWVTRNPRKTPLPSNVDDLWSRAIPDRADGTPKTWYTRDADGTWHQFQATKREAHYSGTSRREDVPRYTRERAGELSKN